MFFNCNIKINKRSASKKDKKTIHENTLSNFKNYSTC